MPFFLSLSPTMSRHCQIGIERHNPPLGRRALLYNSSCSRFSLINVQLSRHLALQNMAHDLSLLGF